MEKDDDKKYEKLGKAVFTFSYFLFALKMVRCFSAIAFVVLLILKKPLFFAPIIGAAAFLIYRAIRILIFGLLLKFARWANKDR